MPSSRRHAGRAVVRILPAAAAVAVLAAPAAAGAADGLLVAPSSLDAEVRAGTTLPPIAVRNGTGRDLVLRAIALRARQELSGLPVYGLDRRARRAGRAFVRVRPARFLLPAGATRSVRATVRAARPAVGRGGYGVVLFEAVPREATGSRNAIDARLRLTANLLLTYPSRRHPPVVHGVARALRAEQGPARTLRFLVRVHGAGTIHGRPQGRLRVRDARGRVVARARFVTGNVLPGADRELPAIVGTRLPAGRYSARASIRSGGRTSHATLALRLAAPGTLPSPDLRIHALPVPRPAPGRAFTAELALVNRGTAPAPVRGWWEVRSAGGGTLLRRGPIAAATLAARAGRTERLLLPPVADGRSRLVVALEGSGRELDRREVVFASAEAAGWWTRFQDWAAGHVPALLAGFGLTLLLVVAAALAAVLRLRRRAVS